MTNSSAGPNTITFNISGPGVQQILPVSPLPQIIQSVTIDGTTQPGYAGQPLISVSGQNAGSANGLDIVAGSSAIIGLDVINFSGSGIVLEGGNNNRIQGNYVGCAASGTSAAPNNVGISVLSSGNLIGGMTAGAGNLISGNKSQGIVVFSSNNVIQGNLVGTDVTGALPLDNGIEGIALFGGATANQIGGASAGARNVICCALAGIHLEGAPLTVIQGNYIGLDSSGSKVVGKTQSGIAVDGMQTSLDNHGSLIGGSQPGEGNVVAAFAFGIGLQDPGATGIKVQGNFVGTDRTGTVALSILNGAGGVGTAFGASGNIIGGAGGARNLISGNVGIGLVLEGNNDVAVGNWIGVDATGTKPLVNGTGILCYNASGVRIGMPGLGNIISGNRAGGMEIIQCSNSFIQGNRIGTDVNGEAPIPNGSFGIWLHNGSVSNAIGGTGEGEGNIIAYTDGTGVRVSSDNSVGNSIRGNSIFGSTAIAYWSALGIDLGDDAAVTPNDSCDADTGPNGLQNFPVLTSASMTGASLKVTGTLNSKVHQKLFIDFYASQRCNPLGYGEGENYLGSTTVRTDSRCDASFTATIPISAFPGTQITATATDSTGNTSEFSACIPIAAGFHPVPPCRLVDTRGAVGPNGGPALSAQSDRSFTIGGQCGIPPTAQAVAFNFTVTQGSDQGFVSVSPGGSEITSLPTISYSAGQTRANNAVMLLRALTDGITVHVEQAAGTVQFIADVNGYFE